MKNQAYQECRDTVHYWISQASDKSEIVRALLNEISTTAKDVEIKVSYDVRD